ncbi:MAG TPA: flavin reductase family protein [Gryllotalpicola sp.]
MNPLENRSLVGVDEDPAGVRVAFGRFPSGVAALCAEVAGELCGMVATSFSVGVSFMPAMVMFSVQDSSTTWPTLRGCDTIGVSVLSRSHSQLARQLSSRDKGRRFEDLDYEVTRDGAVLIGDAALWLECRIVSETPVGDHHIVVLEVLRLNVADDAEPLVYHAQRFHGLQLAS